MIRRGFFITINKACTISCVRNNTGFYRHFLNSILFGIFTAPAVISMSLRIAHHGTVSDAVEHRKQQPAHLEAFDEALVKRWLERIIVWDDHFTVELKSGLKIEIEG